MPARLRAVLLHPLFRLVWTLLLAFGLFKLQVWLFPSLTRLDFQTLTRRAWNALNATIILVLSLWLFERRSLRDVGLPPGQAIPQMARGFLLGAVMVTVVVGFLALVGSYAVVGWVPLSAGTSRGELLLRSILFFFCGAVTEELVFRGIIFRLLEEGLGTWLSLGLSALWFGFAHLHNAGATVLSSLAIALEAGVLLAAMYVATRSLWLPIGLHWAWNVFEGPVWGSPVSGLSLPVLANARFPGPRL